MSTMFLTILQCNVANVYKTDDVKRFSVRWYALLTQYYFVCAVFFPEEINLNTVSSRV